MKPVKWIVAVVAVMVLVSCETSDPAAARVNNPDPITVDQFETPEGTLDTSVEVTLDDESTVDSEVEWDTSLEAFDTSEHGTFEIEGTLLNESFDNPEDIKAVQTVIVDPVSIDEAFAQMDEVSHFKTMYANFDHEDKADAKTIFVPSDDAINDILEFLEMDLDALMEHSSFESLMLDHMSDENITINRLETNTPGVYETLRGKELIVEGEQGSPLIDTEHAHLGSIDLDDSHIHFIDGVILSEDTLSMVGSDLFDEAMGERLIEILRDQGLFTDILRGESFTFFIPNQAALLDYAQDEGMSLEAFIDSEAFETLLVNHIVREEYTLNDLATRAPTTLEVVSGNEVEITFDSDEGEVSVDGIPVESTESIDQVGTILTIDGILAGKDD